jgi:glycosyltransferase involved in cell wall biosynthesis
LRVLHVIDHLGLGGAQSALVDLLAGRRPDLDATVMCLRDRDDRKTAEKLRRIRVELIRARLAGSRPWALQGLRRHLRCSSCDIVHGHLEWSCHLVGAMVLAQGASRPRLVLQTDNDPRHYTWPHRAVARRLAPRADAHIVPGHSIAVALRSIVGAEVPRLTEIPLCICSESFERDRADPREVERLRAGAPVVIGAVGRLAPQKNLALLLQVVPALLAHHPALRVLVVGSGPSRAALEADAWALGVQHVVAFTGERADLATIYAAIDVLVLPSHHEGQGLVLLEAMAARVPVVATAITGVVDVVRGEENGLLVPPGEAPALAAALLRVLDDRALSRRLVDRAHRVVRDRYRPARMIEQTEALYRDVLLARTATS